MITLYQYEISPFCDKVRRILNLKGQRYDIDEVNVQQTLTGRLKKLGQNGKLPVLKHNHRVIYDSTRIAHYLEETFAEPQLIPDDSRDQALVHILEDWADESLYFYEVQLRLVLPHNVKKWAPIVASHDNRFIRTIAPIALPASMSKVTKAQGVGRKSTEDLIEEVSQHCVALSNLLGKQDWLVGKRISLADIAVFCQLFAIAGSVEGEAILNEFPSLEKWMQRVDECSRHRTTG